MYSNKTSITFLTIILSFVFACQKHTNNNAQPNKIFEQNENASANNQPNSSQKNVNEIRRENLENLSKDFLGCYSAGNNALTRMYISPKFIQTTNGKQKIPYKLISAGNDKKAYLLELQEKDKSNFLQGYESITFVNDDEILLEDYETEQNFKNGNRSGVLGFAKDKCETVLLFLK